MGGLGSGCVDGARIQKYLGNHGPSKQKSGDGCRDLGLPSYAFRDLEPCQGGSSLTSVIVGCKLLVGAVFWVLYSGLRWGSRHRSNLRPPKLQDPSAVRHHATTYSARKTIVSNKHTNRTKD